MFTYVYVYIYIYICVWEREKERKEESMENQIDMFSIRILSSEWLFLYCNTAHLAGTVKYTDYISAQRCDPLSEYDTKQLEGEAPCSGALKNVESPFIAITLRSTLT